MIPHTAGLGAALVYLVALTMASLPPPPAVVAVLLFRLIIYRLILGPGFVACWRLIRRPELETA